MPLPHPRLKNGRRLRLAVAAAAALATGVAVLPAGAVSAPTPENLSDEWHGIQGEGPGRVESLDRREATVAPTAGQLALVERLGASSARWNRFGTPHVLMNGGGYLSGPRAGEATEVARAWVAEHRELFRLSPGQVAAMSVVRDSPLHDATELAAALREQRPPESAGVPHVVLFRQEFGELSAGWDGLLTVGMAADGRVAWISSSVTGDTAVDGGWNLDAADAMRAVAVDTGFELGDIAPAGTQDRWSTFTSSLSEDLQRVRPVAFPTVERGLRPAYEVTLLKGAHDDHGHPEAWIAFVDAQDGTVWFRDNRVDHAIDEAEWKVFESNPPFVVGPGAAADPDEDTRVTWCYGPMNKECGEDVSNVFSRVPWDVNPPGLPSLSTDGNNAMTAISELSPFTPDTAVDRAYSPTRTYDFPWNNTWQKSGCNPRNFATDNDDSAATTNLFAMHNRMHDWSYALGFTETNSNMQKSNFGNLGPFTREGDPEVGQSQAGRLTVLGRDNANQITLQDGIAPITNQYLWEPLAGAFYAPCVDGAYDMAIVAHEYGHAISNRMIAGPDTGTGASQGQTESWSDLAFAEYFRGRGIVASDKANPFALAPYVTGDLEAGIRNYGMNRSPLNYSNIGYDGTGLTSPHANGEIWSAINYDISDRLNQRYDRRFPSKDIKLQKACAEGAVRVDFCPGNRRWAQIMFDGFLLNPSGSTMVDSRDAMLGADLLRFGGANQNDLWEVFARRGLGAGASSDGVNDPDPIADFANPLRDKNRTAKDDNAQITFDLRDSAGKPVKGEVYAGVYEARVTPIADTDPESEIDTRAAFVPGSYGLLVRADGFGGTRMKQSFSAGQKRTVRITLQRNLASASNGAKVTGDGVNLESLIDDTEGSNWASLTGKGTASEGKGEGAQVEGRQVTVALGERQLVGEVRVSAQLRGTDPENEGDPRAQSRFSALRSFDILTCDAEKSACEEGKGFTKVFASKDDAFPGSRPRPTVPDLTLRSFDVRDVVATHIRLVVRDNQCTGGPDFQGDVNKVNDPVFALADCDTPDKDLGRRILLNPPFELVRAAELQVFAPAKRR